MSAEAGVAEQQDRLTGLVDRQMMSGVPPAGVHVSDRAVEVVCRDIASEVGWTASKRCLDPEV